MGHYPFTLFNGITLFILVLTVSVVWLHFRQPPASNWPLVCYGVIVAYTLGFSGGLNPYCVAAGACCALAIRMRLLTPWMRWLEWLPLGYIAWRSLGLLLMW